MKNALLAVLILPLLALGGCAQGTSSYAADVRNHTGQPIAADLLLRNGPDVYVPLVTTMRLGPGDRGGIGPVIVQSSQIVVLRTDVYGNPSRPCFMELRPGTTYAEVNQESPLATAPMRLREVAQ